jgi:DNA modification methylase
LIDETGTILAGHGRLQAAMRESMSEVPTLTIAGLTPAEKKTILIADNRLPEGAVWDFEVLRGHLQELIEIDFEVDLTGFAMGEIDLILDKTARDPADDDLTSLPLNPPAVSKLGDHWELGRHRLLCGDPLRNENYERLLAGEVAQMVIADPSFSIKAPSPTRGGNNRGVAASGIKSASENIPSLEQFIRLAIRHSRDGAIHFLFMDWEHLMEMLAAARPIYTEWMNLLVWNKSDAGRGTFYRPKHELIAMFKNGAAAHINNIGSAGRGRNRTNVLEYPENDTSPPVRRGKLDRYPIAKPIALIADLIRDCSRHNGLILDPSGGIGSTILAAERTGRTARVIEAEPALVDVAVRRWEHAAGTKARNVETGLSFTETQTEVTRSNAPLTHQDRRRM